MHRVTKIVSVSLLSALALAVVVPTALATGSGFASLRPVAPGSGAKATAQYQAQSGQREFQVEVDHARSFAGQSLSVYLGGAKIGTMRVNRNGQAEFSRNTDSGQNVPQVRPGTPVAVATNRAVILTGSF
jgi:hypothetical protein